MALMAGSAAGNARAARGNGADAGADCGGAVAAVQQLAQVLHLPGDGTPSTAAASCSWQPWDAEAEAEADADADACVAQVANTAAAPCRGKAAINIHSRQRTKKCMALGKGNAAFAVSVRHYKPCHGGKVKRRRVKVC